MGCGQVAVLLQEGGPLPEPESELLSNSWKWIVQRDTCAEKAKDCWEGAHRWRAVVQGNPGELLCHVALSLGFYGDGIDFWIIFGLSFWLKVLSVGTHIAQPRWVLARRILGVVGYVVSPFDLFWILLGGGDLLVPCFLPRPPVRK